MPFDYRVPLAGPFIAVALLLISAANLAAQQNLPPVNPAQLAAAGIRTIQGKQITLYTDLPKSPAVDELPALFDQAIPQWCGYFGIAKANTANWQVRGVIIADKQKTGSFEGVGLMPKNLPQFPFGFMRNNVFWMYDQPSDYYRRHLFLHEATHAFMFQFLGAGGPPWYSEGMSELFGTHSWKDGKLLMRHFPVSREETPEWGRIKVVRDDFSSGSGLTADRVMAFGNQAHRETGPYAWSWALCAFLDGHPRYQAAFRKMKDLVARPEFNDRLRQELPHDDWTYLQEEWQLFVAQVDYGYDVARSAVVFRRGVPLPMAGGATTIDADKSWQSSGFRVEKGTTYQITAQGKYAVGNSPKPWTCEPPGVTIRYHQGRPLGMLLAAVREESNDGRLTGLLDVTPIGAAATFTSPRNGTIYFKINESSGGLADNGGKVTVTIK